MKQIILYIFFISFALDIHAQKEEFFTNLPKDSVKVASLKGFHVSTSLYPYDIIFFQSYNPAIALGYFNERRIAPTITLSSSAKLLYSSYSTLKLTDTTTVFNNSNSEKINVYNVNLELSMEPRWYFSFKSRAQLGLAQLNSGWYLAAPLNYITKLYSNAPKLNLPYYKSYKSFGYLNLAPSLGFRQSIGNRLFVEGDVSIFNFAQSYYSENNKFEVSPFYNYFNTVLSFKIAYTF